MLYPCGQPVARHTEPRRSNQQLNYREDPASWTLDQSIQLIQSIATESLSVFLRSTST